MAMEGFKRAISNLSVKTRENSPEILKVAGVVCFVGTVVLACKATLKVDEIFEEHNEKLDKIKDKAADEEVTEYTPEDAKKDKVLVYAKTAGKLVKEYAPAIILGVVSVTCFCKSNDILKKRAVAATAAATAADAAYKGLRRKFVDKFGEETVYAVEHGIQAVEVEEETIDDKGKVKKTKKQIAVADGRSSMYTRYLTKSNNNWRGGNSDYIEMFLRGQQNWANDLLRSRKYSSYPYVTFNEILTMLDFDPCPEGMIVGWDANSEKGDRYIQFDVREVNILNERGEYEKAFAIDFNVEGIICPAVKEVVHLPEQNVA